jgi:hypothetical protein
MNKVKLISDVIKSNPEGIQVNRIAMLTGLGEATVRVFLKMYLNVFWTRRPGHRKTILYLPIADIETDIDMACARVKQIAHAAKRRQKTWDLSVEEAARLLVRPCTYCGALPNPLNGLDRIDNTRGYVSGNVTPCCARCNIAKSTMTVEEFLSWAQSVVVKSLSANEFPS